MARRSIRYSVLAFAFAVAAIVLNAVGVAPAGAQSTGHMTIQPAELSTSRMVKLGLGKSLVIDLPRDAKDE